MEIELHPAAREEFLAAVETYEAAVLGLGESFIDDVERALDRVSRFPKHGSPYHGGTRRLVLSRFPYDVVYVVEPEIVVVLAVAHQHRSPGYWHKRLGPRSPL